MRNTKCTYDRLSCKMMCHIKRSQWRSTTINFSVVFISLLFLTTYAYAQTDDVSTDDYTTTNSIKISPGMAIFFIGLVVTCFLLGCITIYARRCLNRNSGDGVVVIIDANHHPLRSALSGLDPAVIDTFPTFLYSDVKGLKIGKTVLECAVCLNEFEDQETLRLLPKCCHVFHPECIDTWLVSHVTCPVCRANLVPVSEDENNFDLQSFSPMTESSQPTQPPETQHTEICDMALDIRMGSPEVMELSQLTNQNRPPRSSPKRPIVIGKYPRANSTGHSPIHLVDDCDRYTLRLPADLQKKLNRPKLRRVKSNMAFPTARSPKNGFRSSSVRSGREKSNRDSNEQFYSNQSPPDRWGLTMTPPFIVRSHSAQIPNARVGKNNSTASGSIFKSVKSPFDRLFGVTQKDDVGERSFARLMGNSSV